MVCVCVCVRACVRALALNTGEKCRTSESRWPRTSGDPPPVCRPPTPVEEVGPRPDVPAIMMEEVAPQASHAGAWLLKIRRAWEPWHAHAGPSRRGHAAAMPFQAMVLTQPAAAVSRLSTPPCNPSLCPRRATRRRRRCTPRSRRAACSPRRRSWSGKKGSAGVRRCDTAGRGSPAWCGCWRLGDCRGSKSACLL